MTVPAALDGYYVARRTRLLRDFDRAARRVRPLVASRYGATSSKELLTEVRQELNGLIPAIPYLGGKQPFTQFVISSAWLLAIYRVLLRREEPMSAIGKLIFDLSDAFLRAYPAYLRRLFGRMAFSSRYLRQLRRRAEGSHRREYPGDYVYNFVEGDGESFDYGVDYLECATLKLLRSQGAGELAKYLCAADILYSDALGWGLRRTMTLAEGKDRCDFRFRRGGKTQVSLPPEVGEALRESLGPGMGQR